MKKHSLTEEDKNLILAARKIITERYRKDNVISSQVGSALRTRNEKRYLGVNIESRSSAPTSICAEMAAIAQMVTDGEREIATIVSVGGWGNKEIIACCGACRQIISQFGDPFVIISNKEKIKLSELLPIPWKFYEI